MPSHSSLITALLAATATLAVGGITPAQAQTRIGEVSIGTRYTFTSSYLKGEIPVRIHLPPGYDKGQARYPVLWVPEIADDFVFASAAGDFLAESGRIPGLIVVAIDVDTLSGPPQGMIDFLDKELIPWVDRGYRTTARRVLYGHSGRSFAALYIMLNRPELFEGYICASLGLSWPVEEGRLAFSALATEKLAGKASFPKNLVFSLGHEPKFAAGVDHFAGVLKAKAPPTCAGRTSRCRRTTTARPG